MLAALKLTSIVFEIIVLIIEELTKKRNNIKKDIK